MAESNPKKNMLLLSGSKAAGNLHPGEKPGYLAFAEPWVKDLFAEAIRNKKPVLFVPYARHDGVSEDDYFKEVKPEMEKMGIDVVCAPPEGITAEMLKKVGGVFVGGGHTYTLLEKLQQTRSLEVIKKAVDEGMPYLGSSAGSIIACPTIKTTNDMPCPTNDVIDTRSMGAIGAQINCHYLSDDMHDPLHQGEKRDTRLREFCAFNPNKPVLGLYEGQALRVIGDKVQLLTSPQARNTRTPILLNNNRNEVHCEVGVPQDVSRIFEISGRGWAVQL